MQVIIVMSGKGGVGKSSVAVQLALTLAAADKKVGMLDADLCGPSIPRLLGSQGQSVSQGPAGWIPVKAACEPKICSISMEFLVQGADEAVVWRGPKKTAMIRQMIGGVDWSDVDLLIVDTPPGTSDEHISLVETLKASPDRYDVSALIVTTPQLLALSDVERQISFCKTVGLSISGIIENMSGYMCPNCTECTNLFSSKGGQSLATKHGVNFLGTLPIDPRLGDLLDNISLDPKLDVISLDTFTPHPHCRTLSDRYSKTVPEMYATMCKVIRSVTRDDLKIS